MQAILKGSDFADFSSIVVPVYISRGMVGKQESEQEKPSQCHWQNLPKKQRYR